MDINILGIVGLVSFSSVLITYLILKRRNVVTRYVVLDEDLDSIINTGRRETQMMIELAKLENKHKGNSPRASALKRKLGFK